MKIIQVIPSLELAGAEKMCGHLSCELLKKGHSVIVVSLYDKRTSIVQELEEQGLKVIFLDKKSGLDISIVKKLRQLFKDEKPDIVHSHLSGVFYTILASRKLKIKRIHTVHNMAEKELPKIMSAICKRYYKKNKIIPVGISDKIAETVSSFYKIKKASIPVILNGVPLTNAPKSNYDFINIDEINILHVGRFSEQKNHRGLVLAFAQIVEKYPNAQLNLIGIGDLLEDIKELVGKLKISDNVRFLGLQDDVSKYLKLTDIFVLPSNYEGVPISLIEAMGAGLPIVASCVGGVPDMLKNNESALFCDVYPDSIAGCLEKVIESKDLRAKLGNNAFSNAYRFSSSLMAEKYVELYKE